MESSVKERVISFITHLKIGQTKFEQICNLPRGYVASMGASPGANILCKIKMAYPTINLTWLITGNETMLEHDCSSIHNVAISTGEGSSTIGSTQLQGSSNDDLVTELRKQLEQKDKEIEFLRNLVNTLSNK